MTPAKALKDLERARQLQHSAAGNYERWARGQGSASHAAFERAERQDKKANELLDGVAQFLQGIVK